MERPLLVATLTEPPSPDGRELGELAAFADWLEVRADLVGEIDAGWLRERFPGELLYTLRSRAEGGACTDSRGTRDARLAAAATRYDHVDLEGERDLSPELLARIPAEQRVVSWHGTAADAAALRDRFLQLAQVEAAHYKLVPVATRSGAELAPLAFLVELGRRDVTAFAAGAIGAWTRLVAPRLGSPLVFGSAGATPAAPGQLPLARLVRDWGLPELRPARRLFGVVGHPVLDSLSPRLHNAAYRALDLDALYVPFDVEEFAEFWLEIVEGELLPRLGRPLVGLSVTAPHKEVAFAVAGAASPLAERLQAANTLTLRRGVWEAESTDGEGVLGALAARSLAPRGRRALVVGCGGAGRAAALALERAGAAVTLANRTPERGRGIAKALGVDFLPLAALEAGRFELIVQATPLGRRPEDPLPFAVGGLGAGHTVVDLVYGDTPTPLAVAARARGAAVVDGREVLLQQAIAQFQLFTGAELPVELGRRVLELEERG